MGDDRRGSFGDGPCGGQDAGDVVQAFGLAGSVGRLGRAAGQGCGHPPDRHGHGEQQEQVEPLVRAVDGQRVQRLDEEEVVQKKGGDGGDHRRERAVADADGEDGEQVHRGREGHVGDRSEGRDGDCRGAERHDSQEEHSAQRGGRGQSPPNRVHLSIVSPPGPSGTGWSPCVEGLLSPIGWQAARSLVGVRPSLGACHSPTACFVWFAGRRTSEPEPDPEDAQASNVTVLGAWPAQYHSEAPTAPTTRTATAAPPATAAAEPECPSPPATHGFADIEAAVALVEAGVASRVVIACFPSGPGLLWRAYQLAEEANVLILPTVVRPGGQVDIVVTRVRPNE